MNSEAKSTDIVSKNKISASVGFKVARFKKEIRKTEPHKHNSYFEIIFLSQGSGVHHIDSRAYKIVPPTVFMVRKEQVHHWLLDSEPEGFVLIIKKEFIDSSIDKELRKLLSAVSAFACVDTKESSFLENIFELLLSEYQPETKELNLPLVEGLIKALLAKIASLAQPTKYLKVSSGLYQDYIELLSIDRQLRNQVSHYAQELNTSPQNLNAVCRKAVNQSAADILAEFIINEAKRLLTYTDLTVNEVAHRLSFSDTSHFIKYFKKHTSRTPAGYRVL